MQEWLDTITLNQAILWVGGFVAAITAAIPTVRTVSKVVRGTQKFLEDWNGTPDRLDSSGEVVEPGKPGVLAQLERVRRQVENDHETNFREDLDITTETILDVSKKLDRHILVSKHHDRKAAGTQAALDEHLKSTQKWTEMLEDLHDEWASRKNSPPEPE